MVRHVAPVDVEHHAVAEELQFLRQPETGFHEAHEIERLAVETHVVVHVHVVADAEVMTHPILVAEIEPAGNLVVHEVEVGGDHELELLARGTDGGHVNFLGVASLECRRQEEIHHRTVLQLGFLGVACHGNGAPPLEMLARCGIGLCVRSGDCQYEANCGEYLVEGASHAQ